MLGNLLGTTVLGTASTFMILLMLYSVPHVYTNVKYVLTKRGIYRPDDDPHIDDTLTEPPETSEENYGRKYASYYATTYPTNDKEQMLSNIMGSYAITITWFVAVLTLSRNLFFPHVASMFNYYFGHVSTFVNSIGM